MATPTFVASNRRLILTLVALLALVRFAMIAFSVSPPPRTWSPAVFNPNATLTEHWSVGLSILAAARARLG